MPDKKKRLSKECDAKFKQKVCELAGGKCEVCGSTFGVTAHHFIPRSLALHLKHYLPNGVCLCRGCHFAHHTRSDPRIHDTIKENRGEKWHKDLIERRKEQHSSYLTVQYYEQILNKLE